MYQLLDNMEVEESREIDQEASALLEEHIGLLEDLYRTMQDALLLRLRKDADETSGSSDRPREGDARGDREELAELDEEKEALQGKLGQNTTRMSTLIQELPTRIISIERLQILRLSLQNIALHVQRRERELQMQTVRRVLLRDDEKEDHYGSSAASPLLVAALSQVDALTGGRLSSTATPPRARSECYGRRRSVSSSTRALPRTEGERSCCCSLAAITSASPPVRTRAHALHRRSARARRRRARGATRALRISRSLRSCNSYRGAGQ